MADDFIDWEAIIPNYSGEQSFPADGYSSVSEQQGGGPVDFVLNTVLQKTGKELHLTDVRPDGSKRKYNFAGPGTRLDKRLNPDDTPKDWSKPINRLDEAAYHHDLWYRDHRTAKERHPSDIALAKVANEVANDQNATKDERRAANLVAAIMHGKVLLGLGDMPFDISELVKNYGGPALEFGLDKIGKWLNKQPDKKKEEQQVSQASTVITKPAPPGKPAPTKPSNPAKAKDKIKPEKVKDTSIPDVTHGNFIKKLLDKQQKEVKQQKQEKSETKSKKITKADKLYKSKYGKYPWE